MSVSGVKVELPVQNGVLCVPLNVDIGEAKSGSWPEANPLPTLSPANPIIIMTKRAAGASFIASIERFMLFPTTAPISRVSAPIGVGGPALN